MKNAAKKNTWVKKRDVLKERYIGNDLALNKAQELLAKKDQSEEEFLGAQAVMILNGLL